jgi:hypothetical protein
MSDEYDAVEKVERTDHGFRLTVESTRGTGTRDQDKVKAELRQETMPEPETTHGIIESVKRSMATLREFQPDEDGDTDGD